MIEVIHVVVGGHPREALGYTLGQDGPSFVRSVNGQARDRVGEPERGGSRARPP